MFMTFMICVHDFLHGEVSVKVSIMEFGLEMIQKVVNGFSFLMKISAFVTYVWLPKK